MKKLSSTILVLVLVITFLSTGCSGKVPSSQETTGAAENTATLPVSTAKIDPMAKYDTPITVKYARLALIGNKFPEGVTYEKNVWTEEYLKELGIKLETVWSAEGPEAYDTKLNLCIASNDLPEIFPCNAAQLQTMVAGDMLEDLTPYKDTYITEDVAASLMADKGEALRQATFNGKLMALPQNSVEPADMEYIFVRDDWRKNLGLPVPKTMEDILAMAEAFTKNDPDKNGRQDTYGFGISNKPFENYFATRGFFNGYGAYPYQWIEKDGKLAYGSIQPEMKLALASLRKLHENKYIDPEFIVKDSYAVSQDAVAGKIGMGYAQFWLITWPLPDAYAADNSVEWKAYPILYADGVTDKGVKATMKLNQIYVVKKGMKNPEALFKMYNIFYDRMFSGKYDLNKYKSDGTYSIMGWAAVQTFVGESRNRVTQRIITEAIDKNNESLIQNLDQKNSYDFTKGYIDGTNKDKAAWSSYNLYYGPGSIFDLENQYINNNVTRPDLFYGTDTPEMVERMPILRANEEEMLLKIITGEKPLEYFDEFVASWKELGGDKITEEVNQWRDSLK